MSLSVVKTLEALGTRIHSLAHAYERCFYQKMIATECREASLEPGMRVLHIGSGRLPMTASALASWGLKVDALDNDAEAAAAGAKVLASRPHGKGVNTIVADGREWNFSEYDAVWISFHVFPKEPILQRILEEARPGTVVVYREPCRWLQKVYPATAIHRLYEERRISQCLGKESVVLRKILPQKATNDSR